MPSKEQLALMRIIQGGKAEKPPVDPMGDFLTALEQAERETGGAQGTIECGIDEKGRFFVSGSRDTLDM